MIAAIVRLARLFRNTVIGEENRSWSTTSWSWEFDFHRKNKTNLLSFRLFREIKMHRQDSISIFKITRGANYRDVKLNEFEFVRRGFFFFLNYVERKIGKEAARSFCVSSILRHSLWVFFLRSLSIFIVDDVSILMSTTVIDVDNVRRTT